MQEEIRVLSQNSEQLFILDTFSNTAKGKFIDIGAYDTFKFSNTRALYEKGFKGVFVEPAPSNYLNIAESYKDDKDVIVLNVAIGEKNEEIDFYDCGGDAISTTEISHRDKWGAAGVKYTKIKVQQMAVVDFMEQYARDADMISIDVEFTNIQLFRKIPDWVWQQIKLLVIEHDTHIEEIESKLIPYGFKTLYINAENIIMARI